MGKARASILEAGNVKFCHYLKDMVDDKKSIESQEDVFKIFHLFISRLFSVLVTSEVEVMGLEHYLSIVDCQKNRNPIQMINSA